MPRCVSEWNIRLSFSGPKPGEWSGWFLTNTLFPVFNDPTMTKRLATATTKARSSRELADCYAVRSCARPFAGDARIRVSRGPRSDKEKTLLGVCSAEIVLQAVLDLSAGVSTTAATG
jgi:hypothetical protein